MGKGPASTAEKTSTVEQPQGDTSITKVNARYSPRGKRGQKYLAVGVKVSMRLWEQEQPGKLKSATQRNYETIGYVVSGRAQLEIEGQTVILEPGDSWVVPKGSRHRYTILEPFTAVEVTSPPSEVHGRDED
ncbi:MAG: cupin domain-containing protein [Candidatus Melainabacteria bacterium]|nr:cupin domain-containing protein [Candidatus Melainabacteria bacterium]